jgi:hypothetical protein|tara:strand:- start:669 stop:1034 length:366 start_codon:yes stop_codon:yes gene_type:complete
MEDEVTENTRINVWSLQDHEDPYWTRNLRGMLGMIDQIMRFEGDDEERFKRRIADFMWRVVQANLDADTKPRHEDEYEHCGTFPKQRGEPGISHLVADAYPRSIAAVEMFKEMRQQEKESE